MCLIRAAKKCVWFSEAAATAPEDILKRPSVNCYFAGPGSVTCKVFYMMTCFVFWLQSRLYRKVGVLTITICT